MLPLNVSLKDIDTSYPSLAVGKHRSEIVKWEHLPNSNGGSRIVFDFKLVEDSNDTNGKTLSAGFPFKASLNLNDSPKEGQEGVEQNERNLKSLKKFLMAAFNVDEDNCPDLNDETLNASVGKQVIVDVKKKKEEDEFGSTEVKGYKPVV